MPIHEDVHRTAYTEDAAWIVDVSNPEDELVLRIGRRSQGLTEPRRGLRSPGQVNPLLTGFRRKVEAVLGEGPANDAHVTVCTDDGPLRERLSGRKQRE